MITVHYFAHLKEISKVEKETFPVEGQTVAQLKKIIAAKYQINGLQDIMTAVNEEFANDDLMLKAGDEVAFIPPVSGG